MNSYIELSYVDIAPCRHVARRQCDVVGVL